MKRYFALLALLPLGCQAAPSVSPKFPGSSPNQSASQVGDSILAGSPQGQVGSAGELELFVKWPDRTVQLIPMTAQTIRVSVLKDGTTFNPQNVLVQGFTTRPLQGGTATASVQLDATEGLTVIAEAFRDEISKVSTASVAIASASVTGVAVVANQKTTVPLSLLPAFVPMITAFSPTNGGPGTPVTITGSFGLPDTTYVGIYVNGVKGTGKASGSTIVASVPAGATNGKVKAWADGVPTSNESSEIFQVLKGITVSPTSGTASVSATIAFSVPTGTDTADQSVANPTVTSWLVMDPTKTGQPGFGSGSASSSIGEVTTGGLFTAKATGTYWVVARSGSIVASASVTVN